MKTYEMDRHLHICTSFTFRLYQLALHSHDPDQLRFNNAHVKLIISTVKGFAEVNSLE